tara:strand:+ start:603 stop:1355 length:753 start_codon:yes stop_codon:yes gene_type:complete
MNQYPDDMIFTPDLSIADKARKAQMMSEGRTFSGRHNSFTRIGKVLRQRRARQQRAMLRKHGDFNYIKPGGKAQLGRTLLGRGNLIGAVIDLALPFVATSAMTMRAHCHPDHPTFEQQSQQLNNFLFGDAPAKVRAAMSTRQMILGNPAMMALLKMGRVDEVYGLSRYHYDHFKKMEDAYDDVRAKVPGAETTLELIIKNSKKKFSSWWRDFKQGKVFQEVAQLCDQLGLDGPTRGGGGMTRGKFADQVY